MGVGGFLIKTPDTEAASEGHFWSDHACARDGYAGAIAAVHDPSERASAKAHYSPPSCSSLATGVVNNRHRPFVSATLSVKVTASHGGEGGSVGSL